MEFPVQQTLRMHAVEDREKGNHALHGFPCRHPTGCEAMIQPLPVERLHDHEDSILLLSEIENRCQSRDRDFGSDLSFMQQTRANTTRQKFVVEQCHDGFRIAIGIPTNKETAFRRVRPHIAR
jgi:hypothetical protein